MADAYANQATGIFGVGDFVDWNGINSDSGQMLSLGNAFLSESGARKVMNAIGLNAPVENRTNAEGWNGNYKEGIVYGPRAARESRDSGPWRYFDPRGVAAWLWLDGYVPLLSQNKVDIAKWKFQHEFDPNVIAALRYVSPERYTTLAEFQNAINSFNASMIGTGETVEVSQSGQIGNGNNAGGTIGSSGSNTTTGSSGQQGTGTGTGGSQQMAENNSGPLQENKAVIGDGGSGGSTPSGMDLSQLMQGSMKIGSVEVPYLVLGAGVLLLMFTMGSSK